MSSTLEITGVKTENNIRLLRALAEDLKLPLMQIARMAESDSLGAGSSSEAIQTTAEASLKLLDNYLLTTGVLLQQQSLDLEAVSLTATLYDTAQDLYQLSKLYDTRLDIEVRGRCGQAMAHHQGLQAALTSLVHSCLQANNTAQKRKIILAAEKTKQHLHVGVYDSAAQFSQSDLDQARQLFGKARQPAANITPGNGAGLYVADTLLSAMSANLFVTHRKHFSGFSARLLPSQQLAFF